MTLGYRGIGETAMKARTKVFFGCGIAAACVLVLLGVLLFTKPLGGWYLYYFRAKVRNSISVTELREWGHSVNGQLPGAIPPNTWPEKVLQLRPQCILVEGDHTVILLFSQTGFFQYGIIILPDEVTPLQVSSDMTLPLDQEMYVFFGD